MFSTSRDHPLAPNSEDARLISRAVRENDVGEFDSLVAGGLCMQQPCTRDGLNPLQLGSQLGNLEVVNAALEQGADVNIGEGSDKGTALHLAAAGGHALVVERLLRHGALPCAKDKYGSEPLHGACGGSDNSEVVRRLLEFGADPNSCNTYGQTPLLLAVKANRGTSGTKGNISRILQLLMEKGADPTLKAPTGISPYSIAFRASSRPSNQDPDDEYDATATSSNSSSRMDCIEVAQLLVASHLGPGAAPKVKAQVCLLAFVLGAKAAVQQILDLGGLEAAIDEGDEDGVTMLHYAAAWGWDDMVPQLLQLGAAPDARMRWRTTPLHYAVTHGNPGTVQALLAGGAHPIRFDTEGLTPFHRAADAGQAGMVQLMLEAAQQWGWGGMVDELTRQDVGTKEGTVLGTALHRAAAKGHSDVVQVLLNCGADRSAKDSRGDTALQALCRAWPGENNRSALSRVMAVLGQDKGLDASTGGQTVLQQAVQQRRLDLAAALVAAGACSGLVDNSQGITAIEDAAQWSVVARNPGWTQLVLTMLRQQLQAYAKQQQPKQQQPQQQQGTGAGSQADISSQQLIITSIYTMRGAPAPALAQCLAAVVEVLGAAGAPVLWEALLAHHAALPRDQQASGAALVAALAHGCLLARTGRLPQLQKRAPVLWRLQQLVLAPAGSNMVMAEEAAVMQAAALAEFQQQAELGGGLARCLRIIDEVWFVSESQAAAVMESIALEASAGQQEGPELSAQATTFCQALLAAWGEGGTAPPLQQVVAEVVSEAVMVSRQGRFARGRG